MREPGLTSERRLLVGVLLAFLAMAGLATTDLLSDVRDGATAGHLLAEGGVLLVGLLGVLLVGRKLRLMLRDAQVARAEARSLAGRLAASAAEAARFRDEARDLMDGLGAAIDQQFDRWQLSPAEKEVALLLLKGLSHREVAQVRSVTEATARQQARALYRKAGLSGRSDLAAFFLEDLMLPVGQREST